MAKRLLLVAFATVLACTVVAPAANATFGIAKWESLTCKENVDTPNLGEAPITGAPPLAKDPGQCTAATPEKWYTQAAGHPNFGITDFTLNTFTAPGAVGFPEGFVKDIVVDTPEGLSVNPEAAPQCTVGQLETLSCPPTAIVGVNYLTVAAQSPPCTAPIPGQCLNARVALPVYNLVPFEGAPSMVGFLTESGPTFIVGSLSPVDQHVTFTISDVHPPSVKSPPIIGSRLVFNGRAGNGTYLTMPSNCAGGQISTLTVDSQGPPVEAGPSVTDKREYQTAVGATGCEKVPFNPTVGTSVTGAKAVDSPEPTTVDLSIPFDPDRKSVV